MQKSKESKDQKKELDLFLQLIDLSPAEREAALESACGDDMTLRQRIVDLLNETNELGEFLEKPVVDTTKFKLSEGTAKQEEDYQSVLRGEKPGDVIDRYKLLKKIGEGGCGVVYLAEQEKPVRRQVALKIIKLGMDTRSVIARFEAERQALALMDHQHIARIFDAGATETGRPYFVMELAQGIRITEYCTRENLTVIQRIQLFISVCQAVQHAHQKGIIHRDLKPSNILVAMKDGEATPKVIDFGIAKATEQSLTSQTLATLSHSFVGTPAYMSPEQAAMSGIDIDTRSDIYSLGIILYELLTGRPPFDPETLRTAGWDEMRRIIGLEEPVRPSIYLVKKEEGGSKTSQYDASDNQILDSQNLCATSATMIQSQKLVEALQGDLDWVVMKCLEKDRNRRYQSVNGLIMDLQRYLNNEPVLARPPNLFYQFQKFIRRHRKAFVGATVMICLLLSATAVSTWLAIRAIRAERHAIILQNKETRLRIQAESDKAAAQLNAYVANINLAHNALTDGNLGRAVQLLDQLQPKPGETDLRGFEWRYLWQLTRGNSHWSFPTQEGSVEFLAISPKGDLLAVAMRDLITLWKVETRSFVTSIPGAVTVAFFPDGQRFITAGHSGIQVWSTIDGTEQKRLPNVGARIALSQDGSLLASEAGSSALPGQRQHVRVFDTMTWKEVWVLPEASQPLAISPDNHTLATINRGGVSLWSLTNSIDRIFLRNSSPGMARNPKLAFLPDGSTVASVCNTSSEGNDFVVGLWDSKSGKEIGVIPENAKQGQHTASITGLAISQDGRYLATASWDYSVRLWHIGARQCLRVFQGHSNEVWAVIFTPDGKNIISGGKDGSVNLWPINQPEQEDFLTGFGMPVAFSPDSKKLVATDGSGAISFIDCTTRKVDEKYRMDQSRFRFSSGIALSKDLKILASGSRDGRIKLSNTESREVTELQIGRSEINVLSISPDGTMLIVGSHGPSAEWWKIQPKAQLLRGLQAQQALFSPSGNMLATLWDQEIQLWDVTSQSVHIKITLASSPACLAFSGDGQILATTDNPLSTGNAISLWDTVTGRLIGICSGHKQTVWSVTFSPDGKTLASASHDGTVKLWNLSRRQELLTFREPGEIPRGLLFSPDGKTLVVGLSRSTPNSGLRLYRTDSVHYPLSPAQTVFSTPVP